MRLFKGMKDALLPGWVRAGGLILPSGKGESGIKVNHNKPQYTWRDLEGPIRPKATGAGSPTLATVRGNIRDYAFAANDIVDLTYHWPHDWVPGTDVFIHIHWVHNGTTITGDLVANYRWSWSRGHNQDLVPDDKSLVHTISTNLTSYPQYQHTISEIQLSANSPTSGAGINQIDNDNLEVDGLLEISLIVTGVPTLGGGGKLFITYVDIHYLSTNIGTVSKAPAFYLST